MFLAHFGVALGAKAATPKVSLGTLFLAAQFIDLLWPTLLLLGVERVRIDPGNTAVTPLHFEHYPVSHSLVAVAGWAVLLAAAYWLARRSKRGALVVGALVVSHWLLDLLAHRPDLPLYPGSTLHGLGLWNSLPATLALELGILAAGTWLYLRATQALDRAGTWALWALVGFLLVVYAGNVFGPPPPGVEAIAWAGHAQWLLVAWGYWIDRHRAARDPQAARLFGELAPMVPPVQKMFEGPQGLEEFKANGEEFLRIYREVCGLRPDERMLDVGCGIGRKTIQLTRYFGPQARYEGIDIVRAGIDWCSANITPRCPNFRFQQIDVHNPHYNPTGRWRAAEYRFPYPDGAFSFVMLGSVFTHMLPPDVGNYLAEVRRVLAPGGRCLVSYFLLNEESLRLVAAGRSTLDLQHQFEGYRAISRERPEAAIGLPEAWVRAQYEKHGLGIARLDYGSWCGREKFLSYQDLVLAEPR